MTFTPNLVIGIGITFIGIVLTLDRLGMVDARDLLRFWPVMLILFGASVVAQALQRRVDAPPGSRPPRPIVTPGLVFVLVIGGLVASNAIQRVQPLRRNVTNQERVTLFTVMGQDSRTSSATRFRGADMTSVMGQSRLDLRQAVLAPGEEAVIDVFAMMGEVTVFVPEGWTVDVQATPVMGGVRDQRWLLNRNRDEGESRTRDESQPSLPAAVEADTPPVAAAAPPRVVLRGFIMMGALVIRS